AAGSIYTAAHKTQVSQLDGIGWKMPFTMAAFTIGSLSMIGLPPTAGFISKWFILSGAVQTQNLFAIIVIVISTLLNAAYFIPIVYRAFFKRPAGHDVSAGHSDEDHTDSHHDDHGEAPLPIVIALCCTALGTVILFFLPDVPLALARQMLGMP
ncbi:MAG: monovalent cation/H+ antiporter subunit D family protein, partial [Gammaproteobacteria bacterium]|nr:monovalent cation/H+ antiporter subunit D family protein [Gammaproteobacteria bacterium]